LKGEVKEEVKKCIHVFCSMNGSKVEELKIQVDHVHLVLKIPTKVSVSDMMGVHKGRTAIRIFKPFPELKERLYWGNHFCANGYCVDTIGLDEEMIRKYVRYQEKQERKIEQLKFRFKN
jgi:putative transposase